MPVCKELDRNRLGDASLVEPWQVHKLHSDEVYLTQWRRTGQDTFRIRARRPREHAFYRGASDFDPLLLCETVRQTFPLLCHAAYDVPLGHQLIWDRFRYDVDDAAYAGVDRGPELELEVHCFDLTYRGRRPVALSLRVDVGWGDVRVATAETRFTVQSRAVYQRLRGAYADAQAAAANAVPTPDPAPWAGTGRGRATDVVLAPPADGGRQLRVDLSHPIYFDHPVDHVPGMLLLEAAHQVAGGAVRSLDCTFHRYVEFDAPCLILTDPGPLGGYDGGPSGTATRITAVQEGRTRFTADLVACAAPVLEESGPATR